MFLLLCFVFFLFFLSLLCKGIRHQSSYLLQLYFIVQVFMILDPHPVSDQTNWIIANVLKRHWRSIILFLVKDLFIGLAVAVNGRLFLEQKAYSPSQQGVGSCVAVYIVCQSNMRFWRLEQNSALLPLTPKHKARISDTGPSCQYHLQGLSACV